MSPSSSVPALNGCMRCVLCFQRSQHEMLIIWCARTQKMGERRHPGILCMLSTSRPLAVHRWDVLRDVSPSLLLLCGEQLYQQQVLRTHGATIKGKSLTSWWVSCAGSRQCVQTVSSINMLSCRAQGGRVCRQQAMCMPCHL